MDPIPSPHIVCPKERYEKDKNPRVITVNGQICRIISSSHLVADAEDEKPNHVLSLSHHNKYKDSFKRCSICLKWLKKGNSYYFSCNYCKVEYHEECVTSPSVLHSSDHPKHPLQLLRFLNFSTDNQTQCHSCGDTKNHSFYYCSICDFMIDLFCAKNPTPPTIDYVKRHVHTLHYFVYLPHVIKVSRHDHRLNFTHNLPFKELTNCGVCRAKINENYGEYSCIKGCVYAIHSKCAMRTDVCDGKEHEGEPEEAHEDTKMFVEEGVGIIRHLSHPHHEMRLEEKIQRVYGETKHCQACRLPVYVDDNVYQCIQCDFILHESCANIPRVKQFMLHVHPLTLKCDDSKWFTCNQCRRISCGFRYMCSIQGCKWVLDTICASVCEPLYHHTHLHPLFVTSEQSISKLCSICQSLTRQPLDCADCKVFLCFRCATLPHKMRYENDQHLLTYSYEKDKNDEVYWCEICEEDIDPKKGLYACNECGITLHIECLLGKDPYVKPGQSCKTWLFDIYVHPNTCSTRPRCINCERRCSYKIRLEVPDLGTLCSFICFYRRT